MSQRYFEGIIRVQRCWSDEEANRALNGGAELLKIVEMQDVQFEQGSSTPLPLTKICYIVGWRGEILRPVPATQAPEPQPEPAPSTAPSPPPSSPQQPPQPPQTPQSGRPTQKMLNYIRYLASSSAGKVVYSTYMAEVGKRLDDLTYDEAHNLIDLLKQAVPKETK